MKEIRQKAKILMEGFCGVCPSCNGKACVGEIPGIGAKEIIDKVLLKFILNTGSLNLNH